MATSALSVLRANAAISTHCLFVSRFLLFIFCELRMQY